MREILFRGKRTDNGEWVTGFYTEVKHHDDNSHIHPFIMIPEKMIDNQRNTDFWAEVIPETVGQFTGLTDKNGKKIFEGDILGHNNVKGIVFYSDKSACFMLRWKNFDRFRKDFFKKCKLADFALFEYTEVIGNIRDNPEPYCTSPSEPPKGE